MSNWEGNGGYYQPGYHNNGYLFPPPGFYPPSEGFQGWYDPSQDYPAFQQIPAEFIPTMIYQSNNPGGSERSESYRNIGERAGANRSGASEEDYGQREAERYQEQQYTTFRRKRDEEEEPEGGRGTRTEEERRPRKNGGERSFHNNGRGQRCGADRLYRHPRQNHRQNDPRNNRGGREEKSEGRRKLLEEAAALLAASNGCTKNKTTESRSWRDRQDSVCQRERLEEQLRRGSLECLVCCERIRQSNRVWACSNCHHVLHLKCTAKWAATSKAENGWRCPACQNVTQHVPVDYKCMCGKVTDPQWVRGETPHCCGQVCGKSSLCVHQCTLLCHPGPCPPCPANTNRNCGCGRTSQTVVCSSTVAVSCDSVCAKKLNCGVHECREKCHNSECSPCAVVLEQKCWCGGETREAACDEESEGRARYGCGGVCARRLSCGEHDCGEPCHVPPCPPCDLSPRAIASCPCGKTPVTQRTSCLDPIPTCGQTCGRSLPCDHECPSACHPPPCPSCPLSSSRVCRCGRLAQDVLCSRLERFLCNKRCTKKRSCGKHKCNQNCCVDEEHICPLPCNKSLGCGRHKCELLCHRGHCPPCSRVSFDELRCECGAEVVLPPVACGTRAPECSRPCPRRHPCNHSPTHNCHSLPSCPPCTVLQPRHCHGKHELRKSVACHMGEFSCGRECGKKQECGHKCGALCHRGDCPKPCRRSCSKERQGCGHPCAAPCHDSRPCPHPPPPCPATLRLSCPCGRRSASRACADHTAEYRRVATALLAQSMADVQLGRSVHTADLTANASKLSLKTLECNDDCKTYERNLRLAIGLQIVNPDLNSKLSPRYPESMKAWAKRDPRLCQMVHDKLTQLVQLSKESKQKSRSFSFDPMNRDKRQFVHEYCKHFGCESVAYDTEPKRNIVATAYKDKCWLPSYSLLEVVQRENGQRKVPLPSLKKETIKDAQMKPLQRAVASKAYEKPIDYFDFTN